MKVSVGWVFFALVIGFVAGVLWSDSSWIAHLARV